MSEINLNTMMRLERLGFKGGEVDIGSNLFLDVPITASLSEDQETLTIDIDSTNDPNQIALDPGIVFAITGFEGLFDANSNPFDPQNDFNFLPAIPYLDFNDNGICDPEEEEICVKRFLRFTTNANAELLALAGAPLQVPNTAQNVSSSFSTATGHRVRKTGPGRSQSVSNLWQPRRNRYGSSAILPDL